MNDILTKIEMVRRATRNQMMLDICDELQRRVVGDRLVDAARGRDTPKLTRAQIQKRYRERRKAEEKK